MKKSMTATDARKDFFKLIEAVGKHGRTVTITREGMPSVLMMSLDEFEGWMETMEIMSDPELVRDLDKALAERGVGTITLEELEQEMHAKNHHVHNHSRTAGKKAVSKTARKGSGKSHGRVAGIAR